MPLRIAFEDEDDDDNAIIRPGDDLAKLHAKAMQNLFHLARRPRAADQEAHEKIDNNRGGNGQEERTNKGGPERGPNYPRKYVPVHIVAQTKLAKMHALSHRTLKAPAPEMVFGNIDCRHCPDQNIVQRYRNRGSDLVAAENPRHSDRQQRLKRIQRCKPEENSDR